MKIEKTELILIAACAIAGGIFLLVVSKGAIISLLAGVPSGALGGCVACLFRRLVKDIQRKKQNQGVQVTR